MASIFVLVALLVFVDAAHKHHPKFPKGPEDLKRGLVQCRDADDKLRGEILKQSSCDRPKEVFINLTVKSYELVSPRAVWVKRCQGLCDHVAGAECMPTETVVREIPIRITNVKTSKESCATYRVEEHVKCGCCTSPECVGNKVFNPREIPYEVESY